MRSGTWREFSKKEVKTSSFLKKDQRPEATGEGGGVRKSTEIMMFGHVESSSMFLWLGIYLLRRQTFQPCTKSPLVLLSLRDLEESFQSGLNINAAEFTCPFWISVGAKTLIHKILDPNPKTIRLEGVSTNKGGQFAVLLEVFEVAPSLFMVDVRKAAEDTLDYHKVRFYSFICLLRVEYKQARCFLFFFVFLILILKRHRDSVAADFDETEEKTGVSMKSIKSWRWLTRNKSNLYDGGKSSFKTIQLPFMAIMCIVMLFLYYRTLKYQYRQAEGYHEYSGKLKGLPQGIIQATSDFELRPLWLRGSLSTEVSPYSNRNLLAVPVGMKQKHSVNDMVQKFLPDNFTIMLFHYDGNVDGWWDLEWSGKAIHIVAQNQTKWWFAKRFLHPDIVYIYDYIFLWDEDLGVEHFSPARYLEIVKEEGLQISQPALDPNSTEIHHKLTVRAKKQKVHRRVYERKGRKKCTDASQGPPCTGFVEGMAPVFSQSAWFCTWHLIQNDLVHGWGMDMKLGYCAQGDRTKNVGIVDSEYIVHKGIQTLGGNDQESSKVSNPRKLSKRPGDDVRIEVRAFKIRRQSMRELEIFEKRWNEAIAHDKNWVDPSRKSHISSSLH
ncbi:lysine ketoglutarate reductase trans-splicing-like protein [Senna tora]|uniref:Lysine ketoglutarate reductase trans-splicing-like protein n=1 Tax=Senna tora TaxID=362788 RepID=A0A835CID1_9FABA|nr:lysine ketoglutarate reductase trans-splicing-like protein [Senna tora]